VPEDGWTWEERYELDGVYNRAIGKFQEEANLIRPIESRHCAGLLAVANYAAGNDEAKNELARLRVANAKLAKRATRAEARLRALGYSS